MVVLNIGFWVVEVRVLHGAGLRIGQAAAAAAVMYCRPTIGGVYF